MIKTDTIYDYNCYDDFKNLLYNEEMKMMMGQLSQVKPQKSNKIVKKNFSD